MRILLITYYFPPCGGVSVQRWLKWLPDLVQKGFDVTVLTTLDGDYPLRDEKLLEEIPPEVKVLRTRAPQVERLWKFFLGKKSSIPYGTLGQSESSGLLRRVLIWLRLNLIIPDIRKYWNPRALREAVDYLRKHPTDIVITTGPPHSTHLIGLKLKQRFGLPWLADWRDPWTSIYYLKLNPPSTLSLRRHRYLERKVAHTADLNTIVSELWAAQIPGDKTCVIYNGFDSRKTALINWTDKDENREGPFRLKYVGSLTEAHDFKLLLEVLARIEKDLDFELSFIGSTLSPEQLELLDKQLPGKYRISAFVSHQQALQEMADANILLILIKNVDGFEGMLPAKTFEYIAAKAKILYLGPHGGETEALIRKFEAGAGFDASETSGALDYLRSWYTLWKSGADIRNAADVSCLSSQNQAVKLISCLESIKKS